jgi:hypothetical protein
MPRARYARLQRRPDGEEVPAETPSSRHARRPADPDQGAAGPEAELLHLQQTAGNKAVAGLVASVQTLPFGLGSRGKDKPKTTAPSVLKLPSGGKPTQPAIAASASGVAQGGSFGGHASVYIAVPLDGKLEYYFVDLVLDQSGNKKGAIDIRVMEMRGGWPGPETSTTWGIDGGQALNAFMRAKFFAIDARKYTYNYFGIGYRAYNCALFAEKILAAAGVKQSAGLVISTPLEVALGRKLPKMRKREKKQKGPAPIPAQYDI